VSDDLVEVGRVGKPHGLQGAFYVERASEAPERFAKGAKLLCDGAPVEVVEAKRAQGRPVIRLDVPAPRGATLAVPRSELPPPEEDSFYVFQLVGLAVEEEGGRALGTVRDVAPGVAHDILELDTGVGLPMVEDCIVQVDVAAGRIVVAPGFAD
jgi:16S rRNA processing protein RimM